MSAFDKPLITILLFVHTIKKYWGLLELLFARKYYPKTSCVYLPELNLWLENYTTYLIGTICFGRVINGNYYIYHDGEGNYEIYSHDYPREYGCKPITSGWHSPKKFIPHPSTYEDIPKSTF